MRAVKSQLERMPLSSQELLDPLRGALAELLGELAPGDLQYCFFINNGTDAVEGAMKLARLYTGKPGFISCVRGFHGKSYGSLSLMGKGEYRLAFEPLLQDVYFVPFGDAEAVEAELRKAEAVGMAIAGVVVEPVQGEAGAIVPPDRLLAAPARDLHALRRAADRRRGPDRAWGAPARCSRVDHWDVAPDIMCLGKALGRRRHAALRVHVDARDLEGAGAQPVHPLLDVRRQPARLRGGHRGRERHARGGPARPGRASPASTCWPSCASCRSAIAEHLVEVRGLGLLIGLEFVDTEFGYAVAAGLFKRGVLVAGTLLNAKTLRIEPALNIPRALVDEVLEKLDETLRELTA